MMKKRDKKELCFDLLVQNVELIISVLSAVLFFDLPKLYESVNESAFKIINDYEIHNQLYLLINSNKHKFFAKFMGGCIKENYAQLCYTFS